jgi:hypothetical protein
MRLFTICQSMLQYATCPDAPFAFTHVAFKFGSADWSLSCSNDSGGSVYTRELERLLRASLTSSGIVDDDGPRWRGRWSAAKLSRGVRLRMMGDSLAVVTGELGGGLEGSGVQVYREGRRRTTGERMTGQKGASDGEQRQKYVSCAGCCGGDVCWGILGIVEGSVVLVCLVCLVCLGRVIE